MALLIRAASTLGNFVVRNTLGMFEETPKTEGAAAAAAGPVVGEHKNEGAVAKPNRRKSYKTLVANQNAIEGLDNIWESLKQPEDTTCLTSRKQLDEIAFIAKMNLILFDGKQDFANQKRDGKTDLPKMHVFVKDDHKSPGEVTVYVKLNKKAATDDQTGTTKHFGPALQLKTFVPQPLLQTMRERWTEIRTAENSFTRSQIKLRDFLNDERLKLSFTGRKVARLTLSDKNEGQVDDMHNEVRILTLLQEKKARNVIELLHYKEYSTKVKASATAAAAESKEETVMITDGDDGEDVIVHEEPEMVHEEPKKQKFVLYQELGEDLYHFFGSISVEDRPRYMPKLMLDTLMGLRDIHAHGVLQGDIKVENLFKVQNAFKLGDFGGSRLSNEENRLTGTEFMCSPERLSNNFESSKEDDVYALGCTFGEILFGDVNILQKVVNWYFECGKFLVSIDKREPIERDETLNEELNAAIKVLTRNATNETNISACGDVWGNHEEFVLNISPTQYLDRVSDAYLPLDESTQRRSGSVETMELIRQLRDIYGKLITKLMFSQDMYRIKMNITPSTPQELFRCIIDDMTSHIFPEEGKQATRWPRKTAAQLLEKYQEQLEILDHQLNPRSEGTDEKERSRHHVAGPGKTSPVKSPEPVAAIGAGADPGPGALSVFSLNVDG